MGAQQNGSGVDLNNGGKNCSYKFLTALSRLLNDELPIPNQVGIVGYETLEYVDLRAHTYRLELIF